MLDDTTPFVNETYEMIENLAKRFEGKNPLDPTPLVDFAQLLAIASRILILIEDNEIQSCIHVVREPGPNEDGRCLKCGFAVY